MVSPAPTPGDVGGFGPVLGQLPLLGRLTDAQREAALARDVDVLLTAGAGSGKTLTLVARYLALLARGVPPRRILAITFTEKAALEMRSRVRAAVSEAAAFSSNRDEREQWLGLESAMDAARIGTIHSFCAEILRHHPAEAGVDPAFEVVDESVSARLKATAAEEALGWLAGTTSADAGLLALSSPESLRALLVDLLGRRLDADEVLNVNEAGSWSALITEVVADFVARDEVRLSIEALRDMSERDALCDDAGEKMAARIEGLLAGWSGVVSALGAGQGVEAAVELFGLRRPGLGLVGGKRDSLAKGHVRTLQIAFDEHAAPWLGGKGARDPGPDPEVEAHFAESAPWLKKLYNRAAESYQAALALRRAVDFDTLEGTAGELLDRDDVRARWLSAIDTVLVDEFQDTNHRQVAIVRALTRDKPGSLFVVGDARQSIYRFRGADVTAFRGLADELQARGALALNLDISFRAHAALLGAFDALLPPLMGTDDDRAPYRVPYTRLNAMMDAAATNVRSPFVEVILGRGPNADGGREQAAGLLADRLLEMTREGGIRTWDDVGMLFRATRSFQIYEDALESAGIPFVTIAGRGFYDRPEVRDVVGMLRALAQPWDDAAMAGLLRSPAFGLSDAALYRLRRPGNDTHSLRAALGEDLAGLAEPDRARAARAHRLLSELEPLVDRLTVADLLKHLVDAVDYRAILATSPRQRPWRNLDKLLADAHGSRMVRVREFLDYLITLQDVGAREGEAAAEASGAVQLMTVHKAKGLQFPITVLADASHKGGGGARACYLEPECGAAVQLSRLEAPPLAYAVARWRDSLRSDAESMRLLYVAMTRAEQKLLVSGGVVDRNGGPSTTGWLADLLDSAGVDLAAAVVSEGAALDHSLRNGATMRVSCPMRHRGRDAPGIEGVAQEPIPEPAWPRSTEPVLWETLERREPASFGIAPDQSLEEDLRDEEPERAWRATRARTAPAKVVGRLVHRAIEAWRFPGDDGFEALLRAEAYRERLVDPKQRARVTARVVRLLTRLRNDALWTRVESADERYHEVPFTEPSPGLWERSGYIDLLYRAGTAWHVIDFKTDEIEGEESFADAVHAYRPQLDRYAAAVHQLLGESAIMGLCFLDSDQEIRVVWVSDDAA